MALPASNQLISMRTVRELVAAGELAWWGSTPTNVLSGNRMVTWQDLMYYTSNRDQADGAERRLPTWAAVSAWRNTPEDWAGITNVHWFWTGHQAGYGFVVEWSAGAKLGVTSWMFQHTHMAQPVEVGGSTGGTYSISYGAGENTYITFTVYPRRRRMRDGREEILLGSTKSANVRVPLRPPSTPSSPPPSFHPTQITVTWLVGRTFALSSNANDGDYTGYRFRWERQDSAGGLPVELLLTSAGGINGAGEGTGPAPIVGHYYHYRARLEKTDGSMIGAWSPWSAQAGPA